MPAFSFDPRDERDAFAAQGWVHVRGGISEELLDSLRALLASSREADALRGPGLAGEKEQHLYAPDDLDDFCAELFDVVSGVCGLRRDRMTLSERHLKVYDDDADPDPSAHKDRFASQISVGVSIEVPEESRLLLYPDVAREENRLLTTGHRASLAPEEQPDVVLASATPVEIADEPGDVVLFHGSSMWHLRRNSAGAALLYLKCNDFDCDPLGEDPSTSRRRLATLGLAGRPDGPDFERAVPVPARRLQSVTVEYGRDWEADHHLTVFGERSVRITAEEAGLLRAVDGTRRVAEVAGDREGRVGLARLAAIEGIDLLEQPYGVASASATASAIASVDAAVGSSRDALRS